MILNRDKLTVPPLFSQVKVFSTPGRWAELLLQSAGVLSGFFLSFFLFLRHANLDLSVFTWQGLLGIPPPPPPLLVLLLERSWRVISLPSRTDLLWNSLFSSQWGGRSQVSSQGRLGEKGVFQVCLRQTWREAMYKLPLCSNRAELDCKTEHLNQTF